MRSYWAKYFGYFCFNAILATVGIFFTSTYYNNPNDLTFLWLLKGDYGVVITDFPEHFTGIYEGISYLYTAYPFIPSFGLLLIFCGVWASANFSIVFFESYYFDKYRWYHVAIVYIVFVHPLFMFLDLTHMAYFLGMSGITIILYQRTVISYYIGLVSMVFAYCLATDVIWFYLLLIPFLLLYQYQVKKDRFWAVLTVFLGLIIFTKTNVSEGYEKYVEVKEAFTLLQEREQVEVTDVTRNMFIGDVLMNANFVSDGDLLTRIIPRISQEASVFNALLIRDFNARSRALLNNILDKYGQFLLLFFMIGFFHLFYHKHLWRWLFCTVGLWFMIIILNTMFALPDRMLMSLFLMVSVFQFMNFHEYQRAKMMELAWFKLLMFLLIGGSVYNIEQQYEDFQREQLKSTIMLDELTSTAQKEKVLVFAGYTDFQKYLNPLRVYNPPFDSTLFMSGLLTVHPEVNNRFASRFHQSVFTPTVFNTLGTNAVYLFANAEGAKAIRDYYCDKYGLHYKFKPVEGKVSPQKQLYFEE